MPADYKNETNAFDFGFDDITSVNLDELEEIRVVRREVEAREGEASDLQVRLDNIYKAIQPLLNNLKSDPTKDYIYWKDRLPKIEAFEAHLAKLYYGKK